MKTDKFLSITGIGGIIGILIIVLISLHSLLLALIAALAMFHSVPFVAGYIRDKKIDLFEPINFCLLTYFLLYVVKPLYYYFVKGMHLELVNYEFSGEVLESLLIRVEIMAIIGITALYSGYYITASRNVTRAVSPPSAYASESKIKWMILFLVAISALSSIYFYIRVGGPAYYIANMVARVEVTAGHTLFINISITSILIAYFLWLIFFSKKKSTLQLIAVPGALIIYLFFFTSRTPIIFVLLVTIVYRHYMIKKIKTMKLVSVGLIVLIVAFSLLYFRAGESSRHDLTSNTIDAFFKRNLISDKFFLVILDAGSQEVPFRNGSTLINSFLFFIPRSIYPGKPIDISTELSRQFFQGMQGGINISFLGELYLNFGFPGVPAGMFILGLLAGSFRSYFHRHRKDAGICLVCAAASFWFFDIIYKNLWHFLAGFSWYVLFPWLAIHLLRLKPKKKTISPPTTMPQVK